MSARLDGDHVPRSYFSYERRKKKSEEIMDNFSEYFEYYYWVANGKKGTFKGKTPKDIL